MVPIVVIIDRGGGHGLPRHVESEVMVRRGANRGGRHVSDRTVDRSLPQ